MKKRKIVSLFAALVIAGSLSATMVGCGSDDGQDTKSAVVSVADSQASSDVDLTDAASILKNLKELTNTDMTATVNMDFEQDGQSLETKTIMDMVQIGKEKAKTSTVVYMAGQELSKMESYTVADKDQYIVYSRINDGDWTAQTTSDGGSNTIKSEDVLEKALNLKVADAKETVNNVEATVLEGEISLKEIASLLGNTIADAEAETDETIPVKFYVNTDKMELVRFTCDLKSAIEASLSESSEASSVTVTKAEVDFVVNASDDDVNDFTLPTDLPEVEPVASREE